MPELQQRQMQLLTAWQVDIPPTPDTPQTLTLTQGSTTLGTYDTATNTTIDIPETQTLTLTQGLVGMSIGEGLGIQAWEIRVF